MCGEANFQNFQLTNFHNINFQKWRSISPCMSHGCQCIHATLVNVSMHITCQMSPCISHGGQCLHACHMVVNVSTHITWCQLCQLHTTGTNFHACQVESMNYPICKLPKLKLPTCRLPTRKLHTKCVCGDQQTSMHVTLWSMSPRISHSGKCLHACHMEVNVSKQIFMTQTFKTCVR